MSPWRYVSALENKGQVVRAIKAHVMTAFCAALIGQAALTMLISPATSLALNNGIARTPPMGWNSWYSHRFTISEAAVLANAQAMVDSGMAKAGYQYVNIDAGWQARSRGSDGSLQADPAKFPSGIAELARRVHTLGLKFGIYTSVGRTSCLSTLPGSFGHYKQDFRTFAAWKVDYVKVDWCTPPPGKAEATRVYRKIARAAARSGRKMLVTVSTGTGKPWKWAAKDGQSWRFGGDLVKSANSWDSILKTVETDAPLWRFAGPGHWNDADILQVGNGFLTSDEARAHFSLWSMLASPLLAGNDLSQMSAEVREILTNREVIAINQDRRGHQARRIFIRGQEIWIRPLVKGAYALLFFNRQPFTLTRTMRVNHIRGIRRTARYSVRNLWAHTNSIKSSHEKIRIAVPAHGAVMLKITPLTFGFYLSRHPYRTSRRGGKVTSSELCLYGQPQRQQRKHPICGEQ